MIFANFMFVLWVCVVRVCFYQRSNLGLHIWETCLLDHWVISNIRFCFPVIPSEILFHFHFLNYPLQKLIISSPGLEHLCCYLIFVMGVILRLWRVTSDLIFRRTTSLILRKPCYCLDQAGAPCKQSIFWRLIYFFSN